MGTLDIFMIFWNNISIRGDIILDVFNVFCMDHQLILNSILVNIADVNVGGEKLKNGTWTGGLGLIDKKV